MTAKPEQKSSQTEHRTKHGTEHGIRTASSKSFSARDYRHIARLVSRAKQDDGEAISELYTLFYPRIYALISRQLGKRFVSETEDIVQEVFISAFASVKTVRSPQFFTKWLYRIAYHRAMEALANHVRDAQLHDAYSKDLSELSEAELISELRTEFLPAQALESKEKRREILTLIEELPATQGAVLVLYYFEGFKVSEIAEMISSSKQAVYQRLFQARQTLKRQVEYVQAPEELPATAPVSSLRPARVLAGLIAGDIVQFTPRVRLAELKQALNQAQVLERLELAPATNASPALPAAGLGTLSRIALLAFGATLVLSASFLVYRGATSRTRPKPAGSHPQASPRKLSTQPSISTTAATQETTPPAQAKKQAAPRKPKEHKKALPQKKVTKAKAAKAKKPKAKVKPQAKQEREVRITLARRSLHIPLNQKQSSTHILAAAGASATDQTGKAYPVVLQGYESIDFASPGSYVCTVNAEHSKHPKTLTVVLE